MIQSGFFFYLYTVCCILTPNLQDFVIQVLMCMYVYMYLYMYVFSSNPKLGG